MVHLESLLGSIDPADHEMAKMLISEIGKGESDSLHVTEPRLTLNRQRS